MKKILHIFPETVFFEGYIELLKLDKKNVHKFILTDIGSKFNVDEKKYKNYYLGRCNTFKIKDIFKMKKLLSNSNCDIIIFHSGYLNYLIISAIPLLKKFDKKLLVFWGGTDTEGIKPKKGFLLRIYIFEILRKLLYNKMDLFGYLIENDYNNAKKTYEFAKNGYKCCYPFSSYLKHSFMKKKDKITRIQVSHSGFPYNNTLEILEQLKRFKNENIEIVTPLVYGDSKYIKKIISYGKKNFGSKFKHFTEYMSQDKYVQHISNIDIYISNTIIQNGMGNINLSFAAGKKVYLNKNGAMWNEFLKDKLFFFDTNEILKLSYEEFVRFNDSQIKSNKEIILKKYFNNIDYLKKWQKIFQI